MSNIFKPRDHRLPDGSYNMGLESLDVQIAGAELANIYATIEMSNMPEAGGRELIEIYTERLCVETEDLLQKTEAAKEQPQIFKRNLRQKNGTARQTAERRRREFRSKPGADIGPQVKS